MQGKRLSIGSRAALAIFTATLFVTSTLAAAQERVLHNFNGTDGDVPVAGLIFDNNGNLYGTTSQGGTGNCYNGYGDIHCGTVFELSPIQGGGWTETVLYSFNWNGNGTDGTAPLAGLIFDAAGNLYGTTYNGGTSADGTVFELTPAAGGTWT
ncbi:MAG: choice-of-anchor tandem repeat GloVer-containing protein, partial [Candidatus Korobacteraceae bacterium]